MKKGITGITLAAYATIAFVLTICNQTTLLALFLGFVLVVEKDEWLTKQVIQAFLLCITYSFLANCLDIFNLLYSIPFIGIFFSSAVGIVLSIISFICLVLAIIAIVRVAKGNDAKLPLFAKLANWAYGVSSKTVEAVTTESTKEAE